MSWNESATDIPYPNSCIPFRIVRRFHPSSRSAIVAPPRPHPFTSSAMNYVRSLPFSFCAVLIYNDLRLSLSWINDSGDINHTVC
jgi:hypothetical protein